jgi:predicted nucleic acid-binding protein
VIVVDSNVIAYLYAVNAYASQAKALLESDSDWIAPMLWRSEMRNALAGVLRRGQLCIEDAWAIQHEAEQMMRMGEQQVDSALVLDLVGHSDCSAYDCEYVALALHFGVKLVTMDQQILRSFPEVAVPLIEAV